MGITINISDNATALTSALNSASAVMPLDAGASVAQAPSGGGADPAMHVHTRDQVLNGGAPPASLVQEIEAAIALAATMSDASSSANGANAGAAPA